MTGLERSTAHIYVFRADRGLNTGLDCYEGGSCRRGGVPEGGRSAKGAKRHGTMEPTRGHRASRSDDGDELERSDEGWLDDGASAGTPC
jgi:hypothetical protein